MSAVLGRRMDFSAKAAGFAVALLLHGAVVLSMAAFEEPETSAFASVSGGLTITIGEAGGAREVGEVGAAQAEGVAEGEAEEVAVEQAPPVTAVENVSEEVVPVETVPVSEPVDTVESVVPDPVEAAEPVEPEPVVAEAVEAPAVEAETVQAVEAPRSPAPIPQVRPAPKAEPVKTAAAVPPRPVEAAAPEPEKVTEPVPDAEPAQERSVKQQKKGSGTFDAAASSPTRSTAPGTLQASSGGGGAAGARKSYLASLQSWLERHKKYPRAARLRRYEGTVQFRFLIDRAGSLLEHSIVESSGKRILDEAVLDLLKRADPMPSMPPEIDGATLELTTSIDFRLR